MNKSIWSRVEVLERRPSATYEGVVYDQDVVIRTLAGAEITLFDMTPMIGTELQEGTVEVVIALAAPLNLRITDNLLDDRTKATVVTLHALPDVHAPTVARPELVSRRWTLLRGVDGPLLLNCSEVSAVDGTVEEETRLCWDAGRLDLIAWRSPQV